MKSQSFSSKLDLFRCFAAILLSLGAGLLSVYWVLDAIAANHEGGNPTLACIIATFFFIVCVLLLATFRDREDRKKRKIFLTLLIALVAAIVWCASSYFGLGRCEEAAMLFCLPAWIIGTFAIFFIASILSLFYLMKK